MNTQMFLVVVTFLTAATLALGAAPIAPSNAASPILTASAPAAPNPLVNQNQQQIPGQPGLVPESDDLKADGFFWGGYGGYYGGGWGGRGYYGGYGGYPYSYGGYRYRPYYGGYGWY